MGQGATDTDATLVERLEIHPRTTCWPAGAVRAPLHTGRPSGKHGVTLGSSAKRGQGSRRAETIRGGHRKEYAERKCLPKKTRPGGFGEILRALRKAVHHRRLLQAAVQYRR